MTKIIFPKDKITQHKYYCNNCDNKFYLTEAICPECKSVNVVIDEPIIRPRERN